MSPNHFTGYFDLGTCSIIQGANPANEVRLYIKILTKTLDNFLRREN